VFPIATVARRELLALFGQPVAWIALAGFVALVGLLTLWLDDVLLGGVASMRGPFRWIAGCLLLLAPAVAMRSIAEERRTGSLHLLSTLPLRPVEIVVGKWLAAVITLGIGLACTFPLPLALAALGPLDPGPVVGGYLGLLGLSAALAAVGLAASAATESQVLAFLLALGASALPVVVGSALPLVPPAWVSGVSVFTFELHVGHLARGVVDLRSMVFFAAISLIGVRIAVLELEHRRLAA
jgi:ABC-2 type transport system permease protein